MSFFKRLKDKFSSKSEDDIQKDLDETVDSNANSDSDSMDPNDSDEQVKPKKKPKKLREADFDEDGLISIEDFEEIE
ncbi:signal recognition particle-docking protein FtsY, partial [Listeria monocytogenes]